LQNPEKKHQTDHTVPLKVIYKYIL